MHLPDPVGDLSDEVIRALARPAQDGSFPLPPVSVDGDILTDGDVQLALWVLYELHYQGFDDVDPDWEWHPGAVGYLAALERPFLAALRAVPMPETDPSAPVHERLEELVEAAPSAGLSRYMQREATAAQFGEYLQAKSVYHLKESDPQSFVLARLRGLPKVRLAELQYDEYGGGRPDRLHQALFATALRSAGLDDSYGAYLNLAPATTLALNNAMSLFALHRRHRAAAMGHLAAFESTSSIPCRRVAQGIRRVGLGEGAADYFEEHIEADAVHEQIAVREICGSLVEEDPALAEDVLFGAWICCYLEFLDGAHLMDRWGRGETALRSAQLEGAA